MFSTETFVPTFCDPAFDFKSRHRIFEDEFLTLLFFLLGHSISSRKSLLQKVCVKSESVFEILNCSLKIQII